MGAIIMDFGKNEEGINLYRINGSKDEIEKTISDLRNLGCEVWEPFELEKAHKSLSVLLKVQIPIPEAKETEESKPNGKG